MSLWLLAKGTVKSFIFMDNFVGVYIFVDFKITTLFNRIIKFSTQIHGAVMTVSCNRLLFDIITSLIPNKLYLLELCIIINVNKCGDEDSHSTRKRPVTNLSWCTFVTLVHVLNTVVTVWYNIALLFVPLVLFPVIHHLCGLTWGWNLGSYFERWSKYKE